MTSDQMSYSILLTARVAFIPNLNSPLRQTSLMDLRRKFFCVLLVALFCVNACFAQAFTSISVFGDSTNDGGNDPTTVISFFKLFGDPFPPNAGVTPVPFENFRFSDGLVSSEHLAISLGLFNTSTFFNYSVGGAQARDLNEKINIIYAANSGRSVDPTGLYVIQAGQVDLIQNISTPEEASTNVVNSIQNLYNRGARHFAVYNTINLGELPDYRTESPQSVADANNISANFNNLLKSKLEALPFNQSIFIFDSAKHLKNIRTNPTNYQITNVIDPCIISTKTGQYCSNRQEYVYWDTVHLTGRVQSILGERLNETVTFPHVKITSPSNGFSSASQSKITINALAKDSDGNITKVEFYQNDILIGTDTTSPYSYDWTPSNTGNYSLTARAFDNDNRATFSEAVNIVVTTPVNQLPSITLNAPIASVGNSQGSITAIANDADGTISKVEFYVNGGLFTTLTSAPYILSWSNAPNGTYSVYAKAYDNKNAQATSNSREVVINFTNQSPKITLAPPIATNGNSHGSITASASDSDGTISKVEFYVNGNLFYALTSAPYTLNWSDAPNGTYTVNARAYDNANSSTTSNSHTVIISR